MRVASYEVNELVTSPRTWGPYSYVQGYRGKTKCLLPVVLRYHE